MRNFRVDSPVEAETVNRIRYLAVRNGQVPVGDISTQLLPFLYICWPEEPATLHPTQLLICTRALKHSDSAPYFSGNKKILVMK